VSLRIAIYPSLPSDNSPYCTDKSHSPARDHAAIMSLIVRTLEDYPTRSGPLSILRGVNFTLTRGESLAVMGRLGRARAPVAHPRRSRSADSGSVTLNALTHMACPTGTGAFRNKRIGFVFQDHHLLRMSVLENVLIPTLVIEKPMVKKTRLMPSVARAVGLTGAWTIDQLNSPARAAARGSARRSYLNRLCSWPTSHRNLDRKTAHAVGNSFLSYIAGKHRIRGCHAQPELAQLFQQRYEMNDGNIENWHPS